jgi:hypothetical protein
MPAPYSDDLRQKVLDAIDDGCRKTHVSQLFNISRTPLTCGSNDEQKQAQLAPFESIDAVLKARLLIWSNFASLQLSMDI